MYFFLDAQNNPAERPKPSPERVILLKFNQITQMDECFTSLRRSSVSDWIEIICGQSVKVSPTFLQSRFYLVLYGFLTARKGVHLLN